MICGNHYLDIDTTSYVVELLMFKQFTDLLGSPVEYIFMNLYLTDQSALGL